MKYHGIQVQNLAAHFLFKHCCIWPALPCSPSVVNIANIAIARSYMSMDVMKLPQGQGSGFVW
jgi:hypothetical protein